MNRTEQIAVLKAFSKALRQEAHNLKRHPEVIWQQMYNRLQWVDGDERTEGPVSSIIAPELARRRAPGSRPWFHLVNCLVESAGFIREIAYHAGGANFCSYVLEGQYVVSAGSDGAVNLWNSQAGQLESKMREGGADILCGSISPAGDLVAVGDVDGCLDIWDCEERQPIVRGSGVFDRAIKCCAVGTDGDRVLCGSADGQLSLWNADRGCAEFLIEAHQGEVLSCSVNIGDSAFVSTGTDGRVVLWNVRGEKVEVLLESRPRAVRCCFDRDGMKLATGGQDGMLMIWNDVGNAESAIAVDLGVPLVSCSFSASGQLIAVGDITGVLTIFETTRLKKRVAFVGHTGWIEACSFSPDEKNLVSAASEGAVKAWSLSLADSENSAIPGRPSGGIVSCCYRPRGDVFATGQISGEIKLYSGNPPGQMMSLDEHMGPVSDCAFSPDGHLLASVGADGILRVWSLADKGTAWARRHRGAMVYSCSYSCDGGMIASGDSNGLIRLWEAVSGEPIAVLEGHRGPVFCCRFHPEELLLLSAGVDGVRLWDVVRRDELPMQRVHSDIVRFCTFGHSGRLFASAGFDSIVVIQWLHRQHEPEVFEYHQSPVRACAFSPDDRLLVSAGQDRSIRVTDIMSGQEIAVFYGIGEFLTCTFAPVGNRVLGGDDWNESPYVLDIIS